MKTLEQVRQEAMELPESSRVLLAEDLLGSLTPSDQEQIEKLWSAEIERRLAAFDRGEAKPIPAEEVFRRIRSRLRPSGQPQ